MASTIVQQGDTLSGLLKASGNPNWANPQEWAKYSGTPNQIQPGQEFNFNNSQTPSGGMSMAPNMSTNNGPAFGGPMQSTPNMSTQPNMSMQPNMSTQPIRSSIPGNPRGEHTGEVPMSSGGRTPVVQGTPSWVIPILQKVSSKYNVPTAILSAVAKQESGFDPSIRQPDGLGRGMFQLDLGQHKDVTEADAFDPNFAADYAAKLLREGFDRTGTWEGALRYYNGGPNYNSMNPGYQGRPISQLTQNYANSVKNHTLNTVPVVDPEYQKQLAGG